MESEIRTRPEEKRKRPVSAVPKLLQRSQNLKSEIKRPNRPQALVAKRPQTAGITRSRPRRLHVARQLTKKEIDFQRQKLYRYQKEFDEIRDRVRRREEDCEALIQKIKYRKELELRRQKALSEGADVAHGSEAQAKQSLEELKRSCKQADKYTKTLELMKHRLLNQSQNLCSNVKIWQRRHEVCAKERKAMGNHKRGLENDIVVLTKTIDESTRRLEQKKLDCEQEIQELEIELQEKHRIQQQRFKRDLERRQMVSMIQNPQLKHRRDRLKKQMLTLSVSEELKHRIESLETFEQRYQKLMSLTGIADIDAMLERVVSLPESFQNLSQLHDDASRRVTKAERKLERVKDTLNTMRLNGVGDLNQQRRERDTLDEALMGEKVIAEEARSLFEHSEMMFNVIQQSISNVLARIQYVDIDQTSLQRDSTLPYLPSILRLCGSIIRQLDNAQPDPDALEKTAIAILPQPQILNEGVSQVAEEDNESVMTDNEDDETQDMLLQKMIEDRKRLEHIEKAMHKENDFIKAADSEEHIDLSSSFDVAAEDLAFQQHTHRETVQKLEMQESILMLKSNPPSREDIKLRTSATLERAEKIKYVNSKPFRRALEPYEVRERVNHYYSVQKSHERTKNQLRRMYPKEADDLAEEIQAAATASGISRTGSWRKRLARAESSPVKSRHRSIKHVFVAAKLTIAANKKKKANS